MKQRITHLLRAGSFLLLAACSSAVEQTDKQLSVITTSFQGNAGDICFDAQMEAWMEKFTQLQHTGLDMFEADQKAKEAAVAVYQSCQSRKTDALANESARKE
jgi:hypothetical protein